MKVRFWIPTFLVALQLMTGEQLEPADPIPFAKHKLDAGAYETVGDVDKELPRLRRESKKACLRCGGDTLLNHDDPPSQYLIPDRADNPMGFAKRTNFGRCRSFQAVAPKQS